MPIDYRKQAAEDTSDFVLLSDYVPDIVQEIRYYSTYNFVGDRIDYYEEPCAILTLEAARALKAVSNRVIAQGYRLKVLMPIVLPAPCAVSFSGVWRIWTCA